MGSVCRARVSFLHFYVSLSFHYKELVKGDNLPFIEVVRREVM